MKILLARDHIYEVPRKKGAGKTVTEMPSGSSHYQHDTLAYGLAELGYEVFYLVSHADGTESPAGIQLVNAPVDDVDIVHIKAPGDKSLIDHYTQLNIPVLATNHGYRPEVIPMCKWVYVSKTQAKAHGSNEYVWNGLNPSDYLFSSRKKDYVLFMATMKNHHGKGLDIALQLSQELGFELVVAGSSKHQADIDLVQRMCDDAGAAYLGDVRGTAKARLLAEAKAFLSPSRFPETFGITLAEALFSGTPVICSSNGAYSEIVITEVGFVCDDKDDYAQAFAKLENIDRHTCREYAHTNFHYLNTTARYVEIYQRMLLSNKVPLR